MSQVWVRILPRTLSHFYFSVFSISEIIFKPLTRGLLFCTVLESVGTPSSSPSAGSEGRAPVSAPRGRRGHPSTSDVLTPTRGRPASSVTKPTWPLPARPLGPGLPCLPSGCRVAQAQGGPRRPRVPSPRAPDGSGRARRPRGSSPGRDAGGSPAASPAPRNLRPAARPSGEAGLRQAAAARTGAPGRPRSRTLARTLGPPFRTGFSRTSSPFLWVCPLPSPSLTDTEPRTPTPVFYLRTNPRLHKEPPPPLLGRRHQAVHTQAPAFVFCLPRRLEHQLLQSLRPLSLFNLLNGAFYFYNLSCSYHIKP